MTTQPTTFNDLPREIQLLILGKAYRAKQREEENMKYHMERFNKRMPLGLVWHVNDEEIEEITDMNKLVEYELTKYFINKVLPIRWSIVGGRIVYGQEYRKKYIDYQGNDILPDFTKSSDWFAPWDELGI